MFPNKLQKAKYAECYNCSLISSKFVPSEINTSDILILVEAPGAVETKEGRPLVGDAGKELDKIIEECGMGREDISYINCVSCRPTSLGKNRTPTEREVACCNKRMEHEISQLNPKIIIAMGKTPYMALGGKVFSGFKMGDTVGKEFNYGKYKVIVTYHPAAMLHSGTTTERGKTIRGEIEKAIKKASETKTFDRQLEFTF